MCIFIIQFYAVFIMIIWFLLRDHTFTDLQIYRSVASWYLVTEGPEIPLITNRRSERKNDPTF